MNMNIFRHCCPVIQNQQHHQVLISQQANSQLFPENQQNQGQVQDQQEGNINHQQVINVLNANNINDANQSNPQFIGSQTLLQNQANQGNNNGNEGNVGYRIPPKVKTLYAVILGALAGGAFIWGGVTQHKYNNLGDAPNQNDLINELKRNNTNLGYLNGN